MSEKIEIKISRTIVEGIQRQVDESRGEFKTVEEYIEFVLTELLKDEEEQVYTPEEEEEITRRLRALGYIE